MLIKLNEEFTESLSRELLELPEEEKLFFHPHKFDSESIKKLSREKGNYYYIYLDESGKFVGYGMLRSFGKYEIPTLGCVVWQKHRGKKDGERLVGELIDKARELRYQKVKLKVHPDNIIASGLYKKAGFKMTGQKDGAMVWMEYKIDKGKSNVR